MLEGLAEGVPPEGWDQIVERQFKLDPALLEVQELREASTGVEDKVLWAYERQALDERSIVELRTRSLADIYERVVAAISVDEHWPGSAELDFQMMLLEFRQRVKMQFINQEPDPERMGQLQEIFDQTVELRKRQRVQKGPNP